MDATVSCCCTPLSVQLLAYTNKLMRLGSHKKRDKRCHIAAPLLEKVHGGSTCITDSSRL
jgi:hypothetical protein